jgi:hypothetical protein
MVTNHPRKKIYMTAASKLLAYFLLEKFFQQAKLELLNAKVKWFLIFSIAKIPPKRKVPNFYTWFMHVAKI